MREGTIHPPFDCRRLQYVDVEIDSRRENGYFLVSPLPLSYPVRFRIILFNLFGLQPKAHKIIPLFLIPCPFEI